ncbi:IS110 family transposase [Mycobacterium sp. OTB74]|jgi:transposase|uniref:IS110 family transposase n=1 Tax=Mycobacterium sp. OTB74 TaxID=1853452 RepID=UPI002473BA4C|nr:IS110 family transposase [Mycobacterium sp. OTB74]MDH6243727.1 transposase [Mycobacterium sp. OTB74]
MPTQPGPGRVIIGVDTHKHVHAAAALDERGMLLDTSLFTADRAGYRELIDWAQHWGTDLQFGIEGTGSYGRGLTAAVRRTGSEVIEVMRPDRQDRHRRGKSDVIDAENAARAVRSGQAGTVPKAADGAVEMLRQIKIAKDAAVKARTVAMQSLKAVLINAPAELREQLEPLPNMALLRRCAALRPGQMTSVTAATRYTLRSIARRWLGLNEEITACEHHLKTLTDQIAPRLTAAVGIGPDNAAELLIAMGDNAERIRSERALAKLAGACPIPASSGKTVRHRLNRGGNRHTNAALHRIIVVRMKYHAPTRAYVARRTAEGKTKPEILRCLKRYLIREIWSRTTHLHHHEDQPTTC